MGEYPASDKPKEPEEPKPQRGEPAPVLNPEAADPKDKDKHAETKHVRREGHEGHE